MAEPNEPTEDRRSVCFRGPVTGEVLAELLLPPDVPLLSAATSELPQWAPFQLLHGGENCDHRTLADLGVLEQSDISLDLVRVPKPQEFKRLARMQLFEEGYHCHDTYLLRIACTDPTRFSVCFCRHYQGKDFHSHMNAIRKGRRSDRDAPAFSEVLMCDMKSEEIGPEGEIGNLLRRVFLYEEAAHEPIRLVKPVAVAEDGTVFLAAMLREESGRGPPEYRIGSAKTAESLGSENLDVLYDAGSKDISSCLFAQGSLFALGRQHAASDLVLEFELRDGKLRELRCLPLILPDVAGWKGAFSSRPRFLAVDETGAALWLFADVGLFVLPTDTLQPHTCCLWKDLQVAEPRPKLRLTSKCVVLDTETRDIYVLFDASRCCALTLDIDWSEDLPTDPCFVRRLTPSRKLGGQPFEVCYTELPGDYVCSAGFTIDGFSDSFCVTETCFLTSPRRLQVLDAGGNFWELEL